LRRLKPGLPVITMSGVGCEQGAVGKEFTAAFLAKPFRAETLLAIVHRTLEEVSRPAPDRTVAALAGDAGLAVTGSAPERTCDAGPD
jgi:DNA-binding NtrC family response regulator